MAKITFVLEDGQDVVVPLKEHITIGRAEDNDILVDDERISMHHAEIVQNADGSLQVFDLKSSSGTFVNGERQLSCTLLHGDTIAFGPLVGKLDMEDPATQSPAPQPAASPTPVTAAESPVSTSKSSEPPAPEASPDKALLEANAKLEADKHRLKADIAAAEKELRDWQQRAEKERALHAARVESLLAEEKKLEPTKAAVKQAETAHQEWLEAISALGSQHADKTAALERLNAQHYEKSTELQRLTTAVTTAQQELEQISSQKDEAAARLKQIRDECEQDEALLNSLRQQIIDHEKRIAEEEAKHATLNTATAALTEKHLRDEAAVKDLETLLMSLEQRCASAQASLQRMQEESATCEKQLMEHKTELASFETTFASRRADLAAETRRIAEARAERAELERQNQELAGAKQQLADARQRLAAVEQRYRDAVAAGGQNGAHIPSLPKRPAAQESPAKAAAEAPHHTEVSGKLEAARKELAELEAKVAALKQTQADSGLEHSPNSDAVPPPVVVQVETIRLAPVPIKSERTRGPGTKKVA
ncbi:FHA domain-containing protein [Prosthecobacter vanneervenii]|uniref:Chromosome segregation ATPase n=1 Tax=Prosthecobacter vanneervenii TaxID=48466 RepID=A0A7W8DJV4_9BACT|nr:FHA domain-containing protein [Prosthecobacter vanneervenii]MBB5032462.1 chromosome segregation ATPase [Prosthecobacter vanneervenii]